MNRVFARFFLRVFFIFLCAQCAHQEPPPGGPVDRVPPEVVDHIPQSDAVRVPLNQKVTITFSEAMSKTSVVDALFISPAPIEPPEINWKGCRLEVILKEGLQGDQTYVITLGTGCKDLRNNSLTKSHSFAFSTGEKIDQGTIIGRVYENIRPRSGIDLWAYQADDDVQIDLAVDQPNYITQTDHEGNFHLDHLGQGRFRIFAVEDLNDDREFDAGAELLAMPSKDAVITEAEPSFYLSSFRLARLDTMRPSLKSVEAPWRDRVVLFFDEPLDSLTAIKRENYRIRSSGEESLDVPINAISMECRSWDRVTLSTALLESGKRYGVFLSGLRDRAGNQIASPGDEGEFAGSDQADTTGPILVSLWPPDSAQAISREVVVSLCFDEAVQPISAETSFVVLDSLRETLPGQFHWDHGARMQFSFDHRLESGQTYFISLDAAGVRDLVGNSMQGPDAQTWFQTAEAEILGSLSGTITAQGGADAATVFVRAHGLGEAAGENLIVTQEHEYLFGELLPGRYLISAFVDVDGNGRFGFGRPRPFIPAEPFVVYEDTVRVRSRWETAGVNIAFEP